MRELKNEEMNAVSGGCFRYEHSIDGVVFAVTYSEDCAGGSGGGSFGSAAYVGGVSGNSNTASFGFGAGSYGEAAANNAGDVYNSVHEAINESEVTMDILGVTVGIATSLSGADAYTAGGAGYAASLFGDEVVAGLWAGGIWAGTIASALVTDPIGLSIEAYQNW